MIIIAIIAVPDSLLELSDVLKEDPTEKSGKWDSDEMAKPKIKNLEKVLEDLNKEENKIK